MSEPPYLSIVATTRNDDHGVGQLARTQTFLDALAAQCERHGLDTELVLVEWNPPPDRPRLRDALRWPAPGDHFEARILTVPASIHTRLQHSDRLPLFQMIAKNVGIRRARGRFVLATNIDLIFPDELMGFLAERELDEHLLYRVDRYDVESDVPKAPLDEQLAWCEQHVIRINRREGSHDLSTGRFHRIYESQRLPMWLASTVRVVRYLEKAAKRLVRITVRSPAGRAAGTPSPTPRLASVSAAVALRLRHVRHAWLAERAFMRLHTNTCGDFTLLSHRGWIDIRGYPELELFSMYIDSLLMYQAHYAGYRETVLPHRLYHIEHEAGFRPDKRNVDELNTRLESQGIPQISYGQFLAWAIEMRRTQLPVSFNSSTWGLSDEHLDEDVVVRSRQLGALRV